MIREINLYMDRLVFFLERRVRFLFLGGKLIISWLDILLNFRVYINWRCLKCIFLFNFYKYKMLCNFCKYKIKIYFFLKI